MWVYVLWRRWREEDWVRRRGGGALFLRLWVYNRGSFWR